MVIGGVLSMVVTCSTREPSTSSPPPQQQQEQLVPQQEYDTSLCEGSDYLVSDDCKIYGDE